MPGLVLELQADATDHRTSVSELLRKALVVSKKLGITHIEKWLSNELNGYTHDAEIPSYRHVRGQLKVWNPYHGSQPLHCDPELAEKLSNRSVGQSVGELDALNPRAGELLYMPFPERIKSQLMDAMEVPLEPSLHVSPSEVIGILDAVRNNILDWALQLEQEGILGEGMTFSREEKQAASQINYHITNNIGSMQNSQLQQASPGGTQQLTSEGNLEALVSLVTELKDVIDSLKLSREASDELKSEIETVLTQSRSPRPKTGILREAVRSIRNILEGVAGNVIASGFLVQLARFG